MKFTEGYWLRSEKANILYASQAYDVQEIPGGMRVLAPVGYISSRGATLNMPTITLEFTAPMENMIAVRAWNKCHFRMNWSKRLYGNSCCE